MNSHIHFSVNSTEQTFIENIVLLRIGWIMWEPQRLTRSFLCFQEY